ncbi:MAG: CarD family transcriptional regulator [Clostridiales bacterium]|nr:CarD family transcriptional regulator [Clostridiales bacterium]
MFNIGDKIVYPMHGAGIIVSIEEKEVLKEKKKYYIMKIPIDDMKVMIPIDSMDDFRIRNIISYNEYMEIIRYLKRGKNYINESWSKRYRTNMERIKRGDTLSLADVIRELYLRENKKGLSPAEKKILEKTEQIFYSELILVTGLKLDEVKSIIKDAVLNK